MVVGAPTAQQLLDDVDVLQHIVNQHDSDFEPQALYWIARSLGHTNDGRAREVYAQLCRQYPYTYYCQLAKEQAGDLAVANEAQAPASTGTETVAGDPGASPPSKTADVEQQPAYRRALELKLLGLDGDAARELAALTEQYTRDPDVLTALSMRLNDVGAYHHALRLARARFRDKLERVTPILTAVPPASTLERPDGPHSGNPAVRATKGQPQHVAWATERENGGRGFGFTGGHFHRNWADDNFRRLVLNALVWVAHGDVPPGGVDSKVTQEELLANLDPKK